MIDEKKYPPYPECYLHVCHCWSGEEWIRPLTSRTKLNLERLVKRWLREEFCGELRLDGEYYARIKLDGEPPESIRCWTSGGFYLKGAY